MLPYDPEWSISSYQDDVTKCRVRKRWASYQHTVFQSCRYKRQITSREQIIAKCSKIVRKWQVIVFFVLNVIQYNFMWLKFIYFKNIYVCIRNKLGDWNWHIHIQFSSVQFSRSVVSDSLQPMNHSTPGLPVHHQLPEFTQTHVHRVGDAIHPSHPRLSPSSPAPNPSQHQSLFPWVNSSHKLARVLEFQL